MTLKYNLNIFWKALYFIRYVSLMFRRYCLTFWDITIAIIFVDTTFTAKTNQNVSLSWTTSLTDFFSVQTHSPYTDEYYIIYVVQGGIFSRNGRTKKYIINTMTKKRDVQVINITIIQVNTSDAGLYSTGTDTHVDGCCLLVVNSMYI